MKGPANRVLTFKVSADLARAVRQAARRDGRYTSAFLRLLVSRALDSERTA
jgi:hypothetical protein